MATNTVATKQTHTAANNASGNTSGPYTISFDYLLESDVEVRVNNTLKTQTTHYTFPSKTSIQFTSGNFPTLGATIEIKRNTDITVPKVDFQDGSVLTESDLDNNSKHLLFGMQETKEDTESLVNTFVSPTAPTGISNGARWYDTVSGRTFIYYVDADTAQWVEANPPFAASELPSVSNTHVVANAGIEGSKLQASSGSNAGSMSAANFTKLAGIETGATADQTNAEIRAAIEAASDSNVFTDADHTKLNSIEASATADQTAAEIRTLVESASDSNVFTDADHSKLNAIEAGATADQTNAEIKTAYEANANTNEFSDAEQTKLAGIEANATADQTAAEIRTLVESATNSNVFTDADHTKLNGIETGATADQTVSDINFTQAGTNAVARTLDSKLKDGFSVKDFGAVGNGTTDDTSAFQDAIDAAEVFLVAATASDALRNQNNRCVIKIPSGRYKITSTLNIRGPGVHLIGEGTAGTMIIFSPNTNPPTTGDLFDVKHASQAGGSIIQNIGFRGISFFRTNAGNPTAGAAIKLGVVKHSYVQSCQFNGFFIDIHLQGTQEPCFIQECNFFQNNNFSTSSQITGSSHIKSEAIQLTDSSYEKPVSINVSNCEFRTSNKVKQHGVAIEHCDGFYIQNSHFLNHQYSVSILRQTAGVPTTNIRLSNNFFDGSQGASATPTLRNVWIESSVGGTTQTDVTIQNCKFNGVGDASTGVESWLYVDDKRARLLNVQGCTFDKALSETERAIFIAAGRGSCAFSDNTFLIEGGFIPTRLFAIGGTATGNSVLEFWRNVIITGNRILYNRFSASNNVITENADKIEYNILIANRVNNVIITNNIYIPDSKKNAASAASDGLVRDISNDGDVTGSKNVKTDGNVEI